MRSAVGGMRFTYQGEFCILYDRFPDYLAGADAQS
jgi:hypothetical protein